MAAQLDNGARFHEVIFTPAEPAFTGLETHEGKVSVLLRHLPAKLTVRDSPERLGVQIKPNFITEFDAWFRWQVSGVLPRRPFVAGKVYRASDILEELSGDVVCTRGPEQIFFFGMQTMLAECEFEVIGEEHELAKVKE